MALAGLLGTAGCAGNVNGAGHTASVAGGSRQQACLGDGGERYICAYGYGPLAWGDTVERVERLLHARADCSQGAVPGTCGCPVFDPALPVVLVFSEDRFSGVFGSGRDLTTPAAIRVGSSAAEVRRAYPDARLVLQGALTSGLSDFFIERRDGHALVMMLTDSRVSGMVAFRNGSPGAISSEQCG